MVLGLWHGSRSRQGIEFDRFVERGHGTGGRGARRVEEILGDGAALSAALEGIRDRAHNRVDCVASGLYRFRHRGEQRGVIGMNIGERQQCRAVDSDDRPIERPVLLRKV